MHTSLLVENDSRKLQHCDRSTDNYFIDFTSYNQLGLNVMFYEQKGTTGARHASNPSTSKAKVGVSLLSSRPCWSASEFQDS